MRYSWITRVLAGHDVAHRARSRFPAPRAACRWGNLPASPSRIAAKAHAAETRAGWRRRIARPRRICLRSGNRTGPSSARARNSRIDAGVSRSARRRRSRRKHEREDARAGKRVRPGRMPSSAPSAARMRAQLRAPLVKLLRLYFSFGAVDAVVVEREADRSESMPRRERNDSTIGIEAPQPTITGVLPHSASSARAAAWKGGRARCRNRRLAIRLHARTMAARVRAASARRRSDATRRGSSRVPVRARGGRRASRSPAPGSPSWCRVRHSRR